MGGSIASDPDKSVRRYALAGLTFGLLLLGVIGGLAATQEISGAVISQGVLVVDSNVKKIQHPTGGTVAEIRVRDGDAVKTGDLLVRLDSTVTRANLAIITNSLDHLSAQLSRLKAERDDKLAIAFPTDLMARSSEPDVADLITGETSLFDFRRKSRDGQKAQLAQRIEQLNAQIAGLNEQEVAKRKEVDLIRIELDAVRKLWRSKLTSIDRVTALERDGVRVEGEHGQLVATIAQAKGQIAEVSLQIIQIDQDMRTEDAKEQREIEAKIAELIERRVAAQEELKHIDIISPTDGVVHELAVHTIGGVVSPGQPIMMIVPLGDALDVEARVSPNDIDQLTLKQSAILRLSAFNRQTTPELEGVLSEVSADVATDEKSGVAFYRTRISIPLGELANLHGLSLAPGMPVEVYFPTGDRTMISYLIKPLRDQLNRAFRED